MTQYEMTPHEIPKRKKEKKRGKTLLRPQAILAIKNSIKLCEFKGCKFENDDNPDLCMSACKYSISNLLFCIKMVIVRTESRFQVALWFDGLLL